MKNKLKKKGIILALYITNKCNFRCEYCFVNFGEEIMDFSLAKKAINDFYERDRNVIPTFMGGEPLIEWSLIKKIVNFAEEKGIKRFNVATNGLLVNKQKMDYFSKHNFTIQFSFDGIEESQNSRKKYDGNTSDSRINLSKVSSSFLELENRLNLFLEFQDKVNFEVRMTLTGKNVNFLSDSVIFLLKKGFNKNRINIMPAINTGWNEGKFQTLKKQVKIIKEYYKNNNMVPNLYINECLPKTKSNISSLSDNTSCGCGSRVVGLDPKGKLYPCFIPAGLNKNDKRKFLIGEINEKNFVFRETPTNVNNVYLNCPVWTTLYKENALDIYKEIYNIWKD